MPQEQEAGEYQANDADALVGEIFSGGLTVCDAIERLRTRLLDLSARNRLLNYRHPKGRCVQIADEPSINLVFDRLYGDARAVPFKYVPEPSPDSYEGKRPEARLYAQRLGVSTAFEFAPNLGGSNGRRLHAIQTLLYPAELERQLRKMAGEAKTAVEETGTNMLFLVFGFLEFYDSNDSERGMLAPLLSLPVTLVRGEIDKDTRTYQYTVQHNGEDLAENYTLREKLRRDFMLSVPEFGEEDEPETYFTRIEQAVKNKRRWKVRRQITLGMLSFGKLAMWADLDTKKNAGLAEHELVKSVFSGGSGGGDGSLHAEDYLIDERPEALQPLIYDADSSQHSAILDVLSGKNLVINGPPGTGKSQTITNVIAAALAKGKKVLFVSEKLAALEVVRRRLNHVGLGHFCLELHSHKTQKKKFLEDIQARLEESFPGPAQFQAKLAILQRQKVELRRYAELMGSKVGNALGMTVNEVFWAAERRRQELGDLAAQVNVIGFPDASQWAHDDIAFRRSRLAGLAGIYHAIGKYGLGHPWWGFRPEPLAPSDDEAIARVTLHALDHARSASQGADEAVAYFGFTAQPDVASAARIRNVLESAPAVPDGTSPSLLSKMFDPDLDPKGLRSSRLLSDVAKGVTESRTLFESAARVLADGARIAQDEMEAARRLAEQGHLSVPFLSADIALSMEAVRRMEKALESFDAVVRVASPAYAPLRATATAAFITTLESRSVSTLASFPIRIVSERTATVLEAVERLSGALSRIDGIATRRGLPFDSTPESVAKLANQGGLTGLTSGVPVDEAALAKARRYAAFPLADKPVAEMARLRVLLEAQIASWMEAIERCSTAAEKVGLRFDSTAATVAEILALSKVAVDAPNELLEYRGASFGHPRMADLIDKTTSARTVERDGRASLGQIFYLDALPAVDNIKSAVAALRSKDGLLSWFDGDWRKAKRLHAGLCREKRKLGGRERAEELAALASWIKAREAFASDDEVKAAFGGLFRGLDTDPDAIARLHSWYQTSRATMVVCPGLTDKIDLTSIPAVRVAELAAKAGQIAADAEHLAGAEAAVRSIFGAGVAGFHDALSKGWENALGVLVKAAESLGIVVGFFATRVDSSLSPRDALCLMEARAELTAAGLDLATLISGEQVIRVAGGDELGDLASLAGGPWREALSAISRCAMEASEAATQATVFAVPESPMAVAGAFAKAKRELDSAWGALVSLPAWDSFKNWQDLTAAAREDAGAAKEILEKFAPIARNGVSASQVFAAAADEAEANAVLERLATSADVRRVLDDMFSGAETDLDGLSMIHGWGAAICALDLPKVVRRQLLSEDAKTVLEHSKRIYRLIDDGCRGTRDSMERLSSFGAFSWTDWQAPSRSTQGRDLPSELVARLYAPVGDPGSVLPWSKYLSLRTQAKQEGLGDFVAALETGNMPASALSAAFDLAAYQSIGRSIYRAFPELSRFNGAAHEKVRSDYRALDAEIVSLTGQDFASQIARKTRAPEGQRGATVGDYTEMHLLRREINKRRRHIPIRQLVTRAGRALQELKPCFMMGPLSVAQYLDQGALRFDLVVMDEASQLRPEEALGAVARGAQLVVVGDPKQLPPTSFFDRMLDAGDDEDEDDAPAAITGMESILDICQQLFTPVRSLRWHYRSHHESLIAFSNHHFYKNLIVFPSPYAKSPGLGVKYRYVRGGLYKDRQNVPEAHRLVDAVLEHMLKRPDESLGVVTLNQTQRELIEELLEKKLKTFSEGDTFLERWVAEGWPFFIKNLENVQGDERDVIFISTTFGKSAGTDRVRQNFGPISRPDGWRRLNVLFTRAKRRIELFTSMGPEDIVVEESTPLGTKALRDYLDFAKRGVLVTTDEGEREPDSDFEISVANVVSALGFKVKPQLGVAGFFIDMAVRNPDRPGEFLAGIECDGATYHSGFAVRDRDRIRQEILESLGWKGRIYRIWSTDWFYNPRRETERLREFLEERRRLSPLECPVESEDDVDPGEDDLVEEMVDDELVQRVAEEIVETSGVGDDLFVEVGDRVTYCPVDDPADRHSILIVDSESNVRMGIVNENAGLAQALIGLSSGEEGVMEIQGQRSRRLRVIKVQRQEQLFA